MPILKNGSEDIVSNYRPNFLLLLVPKLQERLIHTVLYSLITTLIPGCCLVSNLAVLLEALVHMTQAWHQNMEDGLSTLCIFLDLGKEFNTVPHFGILSKAGIYTRFFNYI